MPRYDRARGVTFPEGEENGLPSAETVPDLGNRKNEIVPRMMVPIAAGIEDTFEQRVDGRVAEREHPKGKRASDTSLPSARALGAPTEQAEVFEDALAGVAAGRDGRPCLRGRRRPNRAGRRTARARGRLRVTDPAELLEP